MLNCTSERFTDVAKTASMAPGPGQFASPVPLGRKKKYAMQSKSAKEMRVYSSAMNPIHARKPTFGASSRDDKSPWSYLAAAASKGDGMPGPLRYKPMLVAVTKGGKHGTFDDVHYTEAKPTIAPGPTTISERFPEKSQIIKEPGAYLGHSDPATGCFGSNSMRKSKFHVNKKRSSTFGTSRRFVRKFSSRAGLGPSRQKKRSGRRKGVDFAPPSGSSSDLLSTIKAMKDEAKRWVSHEENVALYGPSPKRKSTFVPKKRREMLKSSTSQPSFCAPGFGTSRRFDSEKGTEEAFHKWMPGPGFHQKVNTGARRKKKGGKKLGLAVPKFADKEDTLDDVIQRSSKYIRKKGTFGGATREPMSKLLQRWGLGLEVEGPGPMDYDFQSRDGFADQLKSANARCRVQQEKRKTFLTRKGKKPAEAQTRRRRPVTAGPTRSPSKLKRPMTASVGRRQTTAAAGARKGRASADGTYRGVPKSRPASGPVGTGQGPTEKRRGRPRTASAHMQQRLGAPPSLEQFGYA
jgi:hypothetical protein